MAQIFILPSPATLKRLLQKLPLDTGINDVIFQHLKNQGSRMDAREKICILMWDEVQLMTHLQYDQKFDKIVGFEDWGHRRTSKFADHACVFMLRGLRSGWKLPISYTFCNAQTNSSQLIRSFKEIVRAVAAAGFQIVGTVCDQGQSFAAAVRLMLHDSRKWCEQVGIPYSEAIIDYISLINDVYQHCILYF